jgi:hypothetical protein
LGQDKVGAIIVKEQVAKAVVEAAIEISRELGDLYRNVNKEDIDLKDSLAESIYNVHEYIIHPILNEFPDLKAQICRIFDQ